MSLRQVCVCLFFALMLPVHAEKRTWTSTDGKSAFEDELLEYNATGVRVNRASGFKTFILPPGKLSETDQTFVKDQDEDVPLERSTSMIEAIKAAGGTKAQLSILAGEGHLIASGVYAKPELHEWIFAQRLGSPSNP
jgi:hypothetical protein